MSMIVLGKLLHFFPELFLFCLKLLFFLIELSLENYYIVVHASLVVHVLRPLTFHLHQLVQEAISLILGLQELLLDVINDFHLGSAFLNKLISLFLGFCQLSLKAVDFARLALQLDQLGKG